MIIALLIFGLVVVSFVCMVLLKNIEALLVNKAELHERIEKLMRDNDRLKSESLKK